jgi:hypothetical protein
LLTKSPNQSFCPHRVSGEFRDADKDTAKKAAVAAANVAKAPQRKG